jgi:hypothetical protein
MSGRIRTMGAGNSGSSSRGVNVNGIQKLTQGLPPSIGANSAIYHHIQTNAHGNKRDWVFPINQLSGGVGRYSGISAPTADGARNFTPYQYPYQVAPAVIDEMLIDFSDYSVAPISAPPSIQHPPDQIWSGGAQPYFQNSTTETITTAQSVDIGGKSWYTGVNTYNNPGQGSPHTPKLQVEQTAPNEAAFNELLKGATIDYSFYFRSEGNSADGAILKVYNGTYQGNDRTGMNINIENKATGIDVYTYDFSGGSFPISNIATNLTFQQWHKVDVNIKFDINHDPDLEEFTYSINGSPPVILDSWINKWRADNLFTLSYGTPLAIAASNAPTGWYMDNIYYKYQKG